MGAETKNFFDHLNAVIKFQDKNYWKTLSADDKKSWNTYMMMRYLSMNPYWTELIDLIQPYAHSLRDEDVYKVLLLIIPKGRTFIRYIKRDKKTDIQQELIDKTMIVFECSSKEAEDYITIMNKHQLEEMLDLFGLDKKRITKLLKEIQ